MKEEGDSEEERELESGKVKSWGLFGLFTYKKASLVGAGEEAMYCLCCMVY